MDQIFFIFLLFNILFLIERKAINILICFVGIVLTLAIQISTIFYIDKNINILSLIDGQYFSYILILVQVSALTILFGFIIMLYPTLSKDVNFKSSITLGTLKFKSKKLIFIFLILLEILIYIFFYQYFDLIKSFFYSFYNEFYYWLPSNYTLSQLNDFDTSFLRKLGNNLYNDENNIIKLIFLTIILLFAIIALFFLI